MKNKLMYAMPVALLVAAACGGGDGAMRADQARYETVEEGSASGVTSTIAGPGESIPPLTGTNADTTTAFALNPSTASAATPMTAPMDSEPYSGAAPYSGTASFGSATTAASARRAEPRQASVPPVQPEATPSAEPEQTTEAAPAPAEQTDHTTTSSEPPATTSAAPEPADKDAEPSEDPGEEQPEEVPPPPPLG